MSSAYKTPQEVADRYGVNRLTVYKMMKTGGLPAPIRIGGKILFRVKDLDEWEARQLSEANAKRGV